MTTLAREHPHKLSKQEVEKLVKEPNGHCAAMLAAMDGRAEEQDVLQAINEARRSMRGRVRRFMISLVKGS